MSIRSHELARAAYRVVDARKTAPVGERIERKKYGALAHKLPSLILQNGLAQATGFLMAKGKLVEATPADGAATDHSEDRQRRPDEHYALLDDLREVLHAVGATTAADRDALHQHIIHADMAATMRLTRHSLAACGWMKRYVQGVLGVDSTGASINETEADHAD